MKKRLLPLGFVPAGSTVLIRELDGGRNLSHRLTEMGLVCGTAIRVIKNDVGGPLIVSVGEGRLALGRGMALKILVEEEVL